MGSGEPAYRIASRIFARFANFLESVVVLKIGKFPDKILSVFQQSLAAIISGEMYVVPLCFCALGPSKSKCINYWKKKQLVVSDFIERTVLLAGIHLYRDINSKNINCFIGYYFLHLSKYGI